MNVAISRVAAAPIRAQNTDRSEMVNQLLLGEAAEILKIADLWVEIRKIRDNYTGWINKNELFIAENKSQESDLAAFLAACEPFSFAPFTAVNTKSEHDVIIVLPGASVHELEPGVFSYPFGRYKSLSTQKEFKKESILDTARQFLGTPYLWGGISLNGIDCSGFTQTTALLHGIHIARDASAQAKLAIPINREELTHKVSKGDLLFFNPSASGNISHVGFYLGEGNFIHASGCVMVNCLFPNLSDEQYPYNTRYGESLCSYLPLDIHK